MKKWVKNLEIGVDKLIPYMFVLILGIIIIEFSFSNFSESYHKYILVGDYLVILVFTVDLALKYNKIRNFKRFIKECWLDILAVFPFLLLFKAVAVVVGLFSHGFGEGLRMTQHLLHGGLELEKGSFKLVKLIKSTRFMNIAKPLFRLPRFLKYLTRNRRKKRK